MNEERRYKLLVTKKIMLAATQMLVSSWLYCFYANKCFIYLLILENLVKFNYSVSHDINIGFQEFIPTAEQHGLATTFVSVCVCLSHTHTHTFSN